MEPSDHPSLDGVKKIPRVVSKIASTNFPPPPQQNSPRRGLKIVLAIIVLAIIILGGFVLARAGNLTGKIFVGQKSSFYNKISDLLKSQFGGVKLFGEDSGQINVLLLGIGGEGHEGPYLSDTIIVAQVRPLEDKISLISVPRDYLANLDNLGERKINNAFAEGYSKNKDYNEGGLAATRAVEKLSGLTIPYFAVLDFKGFEKAIDLVGGVDVQIDRTFTDYSYPDANYGYLPPVKFSEGPEHMSGRRALEFSRSRHAAGPEGSDFARSQRQQKIIQAFKAKVSQINLITDANKINQLLDLIGDHFHTNLSLGEIYHLYTLEKTFSSSNVTSLSLDPSTNLICPQILESNGAYVLTPCPGKSLTDIQNFFKNSFSIGPLAQEKSIVWLADTTLGQNLYKKAEQRLQNAGLTVYKITYKGQLSQNVVYQVNRKPGTMEFIKNNLNAAEVTLPPPGVKINKDKVDVILILGSTIPEEQSLNIKQSKYKYKN